MIEEPHLLVLLFLVANVLAYEGATCCNYLLGVSRQLSIQVQCRRIDAEVTDLGLDKLNPWYPLAFIKHI